jgi:uncharacterized protein YwqG
MLIEKETILEGEREWLRKIHRNLLSIDLLERYSKWLASKDSKRSIFISQFTRSIGSNFTIPLPQPTGFHQEWLDTIGFELINKMVQTGCTAYFKNITALVRPALRLILSKDNDPSLEVGESKIGGDPDLPPGMPWPLGEDCRAIYNDDTAGEKRQAGFLAQVNLQEIAVLHLADDLPERGLLSFFCFQDIENDNCDKVGVACYYFPGIQRLERRTCPPDLSEGNTPITVQRLYFEETLDLPETYDSPWTNEYGFDTEPFKEDFFYHFAEVNFYNTFGYARATTGGDPTPSKDYQHLILLENSAGCRLHIPISKQDLKDCRFENVILAWVDFD